MVVRPALALAALALACLPQPRGQCAQDADCAGAPPGSFCAEGVCQGPPAGAVDVPARAFARSESAHVRVRPTRVHGSASGRVVVNGTVIDLAREPDGALGADVPMSLAAPGSEGALAFSAVLRDDLGHETVLPGSVTVDDRAPRVTLTGAPSSAVLRGTQVSLRATVEDLSAVTIAGATKNTDGSYAVTIDTRAAPAADDVYQAPVVATDALGNSTTAFAAIPLTRLKFSTPSNQSVMSLVLTDRLIWAELNHSDFWVLNRSDGAEVMRPPSGGYAFPEFATDGARLFFARSDSNICRLAPDGSIQLCCGPYATLAAGPILQDKTAIVATTGTSTTSSRLYAIRDDTTCVPAPSSQLADFATTTPAIGRDGVVYAGAAQAIVTDQFDGVAWNDRLAQVTAESPYYYGSPAFRANEVLLTTGPTARLDTFAFTTPLGAPAPTPATTQVTTAGLTITSPTIAADGSAVFATNDRHLIALRPDNSLKWTVSLPDQPTAPPSHGANQVLYVGTAGGDILALSEADGSTIWSYKAASAVRGPLAPGCDGVLYAASDGAVIALVIDAPGLEPTSAWPKAAHDVRGTGDARRPLQSAGGACLE